MIKTKGKAAFGWVNSKKNNRLLSAQRKDGPRASLFQMASKYRRYQKRDATGRNITWNRDTNAARNIRCKGRCDVMGIELHPAFHRGNQADQGGEGGGGGAQAQNRQN